MQINFRYLTLTIGLLAIELFIAIAVRDVFIRPFVGDVLVVILIYCFIRTFWKIDKKLVAGSVLVFAWTIEILQYFNFVDRLGLRNNRVLAIALGSTFDPKDLIAYTLGIAIVLWLELGIRN
jgi:hypothetical protein